MARGQKTVLFFQLLCQNKHQLLQFVFIFTMTPTKHKTQDLITSVQSKHRSDSSDNSSYKSISVLANHLAINYKR